MAIDTTQRANAIPSTEANDTPIPEEFIIPEEHIVNSDADSAALSIDMLNNMTPINRQRDELERQKLEAPIGDWFKNQRWEMNDPYIVSDDRQEGDVNPAGRTIISFTGYCKPRVENNIEYNPKFFFRISPDKRMSPNNDQKPDMPYKLWLKVQDLYLAIHREQWTTGKQLFDMLKEEQYVIRTYKGDNNPIADIKKYDAKRMR